MCILLYGLIYIEPPFNTIALFYNKHIQFKFITDEFFRMYKFICSTKYQLKIIILIVWMGCYYYLLLILLKQRTSHDKLITPRCLRKEYARRYNFHLYNNIKIEKVSVDSYGKIILTVVDLRKRLYFITRYSNFSRFSTFVANIYFTFILSRFTVRLSFLINIYSKKN